MKRKIISLPIEKYTFSEITNDLAKVSIQVYHDGYNPNGSFFEYESFDKSKESFKNKPICCAYEYDDNDEIEDFKEHNEEEQPCGVIPETNNFGIVNIDELNWAVVDGIIFKEYCEEAYQLLKNGKKISMEIEVLDGFKGKDGFYHIKQFNLLCVTILGDRYNPAMGENATITLYNNLDSEMFVTKFSEILSKVNSIVNNESTEGGKEMKRKDILAKFSALSKVEGYQSIVDNTELSEEELEQQLFTLSMGQISMFLQETLSTEKIIKKYWDGEAYETNKYYLEDVISKDNIAVVYNTEDYKYYGIPYNFTGDKINIDFKKCKRYIIGDWREFSEGDLDSPENMITTFTNEIVEQAKKEIENIKSSFNVEETEEYKTLKGELDSTKSKFTDLQSDNEKLELEVKSLREFKENRENEIKKETVDAVLDKFSELKEVEGYDEVFKKRFEYSLEDLETKLKVLAFDSNTVIGKKQSFSNKNDNKPVQLPVEPSNEHDKYTGVWNILDEYKKD